MSAAALGGPWLDAAGAATDDELAFANFGVSAEFLLKDFYTRALAGKQFAGARANVLRQGRSAATQHAKALSDLLVGAGGHASARGGLRVRVAGERVRDRRRRR